MSDSDLGEMFAAQREATRQHRAEMLAKADTEGWHQHTEWHYSRTFAGKRMDWWPSGGKARFDGKMIYGHRRVNALIAKLKEHEAKAGAVVQTKAFEARSQVLEMVAAASATKVYSPRFHGWLVDNYDGVWTDFRNAADKVRDKGLTEYSAYVIVNVLRWRADVRGLQFSMSNTLIPDLARLYNAMYGPLFKTSSRFGKETT